MNKHPNLPSEWGTVGGKPFTGECPYCERLRAEVERLRERCKRQDEEVFTLNQRYSQLLDRNCRLAQECVRLEAEVERLKADKERLDWLESRSCPTFFAKEDDLGNIGWEVEIGEDRIGKYVDTAGTLRELVDDARKIGEETR